MAEEKEISNKRQVTRKKAEKVENKVETSRLASAHSKNNTQLITVRAKSRTITLSIPVFSLVGKEVGFLELPKEIFGVKVNSSLLAQAMRIYLNNQKSHWSNTKTRGEVTGSTRKIYKQKGTGRARHGAITAPIFVGGGVALGPKARKVVLELPKKMKRVALLSALAQKLTDSAVKGILGLEKSSGKTKEMANLFRALNLKSALVVGDKKIDIAQRALRNIKGVNFLPADQLNAFEIIRHQSLLLTKEAVEKLQAKVAGKKEEQAEEPIKRKRSSKKI